MKHNFSAMYENIKIRPLVYGDIESLRVWRNNTYDTRFLRPIGNITSEMQEKWFEDYLLDSNQIVFAIEETKELNRMVGSVALYDIHDSIAEVGKIQIGDPDAHGKGIGRKSLVMTMAVGFEKLDLTKIVASVHQENVAARSNDLKIGFRIVGQHESVVGGFEDEIEITQEELKKTSCYYEEIVIS